MEIRHVIQELVDARKGIHILGTRFVEVGVVSAHAPFPIVFSHHDNISKPGRVSNLSNILGFEQLVDLFPDHFT